MKTLLLRAALLTGVGVLPPLLLPTPAASTTRLVTAEVSVAGEVVLRASTSDDGHPDADAVWAYLRALRFAPTDAFAAVPAERRDEAEDGALVLLGRADPERGRGAGGGPWRHADVQLDVAYGGTAEVRSLRLLPTDEGWRVDPAEAERSFTRRTIRRGWAARLEEPGRTSLDD